MPRFPTVRLSAAALVAALAISMPLSFAVALAADDDAAVVDESKSVVREEGEEAALNPEQSGEGEAKGEMSPEESAAPGEKESLSADQIRELLLNKRIEIDFSDTPIQDAFSFLSESLGIDFIGIARIQRLCNETSDRTVSLKVGHRPVPVKVALDLLIEEIGKETYDVYYIVEDDFIRFKIGQGDLQLRIFNCREWLASVGPVAVPLEELTDTGKPSTTKPANTQSNSKSDKDAATAPSPVTTPNLSAGQALTNVVRTTIAPASWEENGGEATITEFGGLLIVRQTPAILEQIEQLIDEIGQQILSKPLPAATAPAQAYVE